MYLTIEQTSAATRARDLCTSPPVASTGSVAPANAVHWQAPVVRPAGMRRVAALVGANHNSIRIADAAPARVGVRFAKQAAPPRGEPC